MPPAGFIDLRGSLYLLLMEWYYIDSSATGEARRKGPWSSVQMLSFAERGLLNKETLVWNNGLADWEPWEKHHSAALADVPPEPTLKTVAVPGTIVLARPYAGFWIRGAALFIDGVIMQVLYLGLYPLFSLLGLSEAQVIQGESLPQLFLLLTLQVFMSAGYHSWFVKRYAGTPGKILLGLSVVRADGASMDWSTAIGRYFATWISSLTLGIGYLMAAFDDEKRTLHDHIARTRVLRRPE